ncbi:helix-turn-helix domain protein [Paraburkholderia xenovorans LB400]|uniref:helix-turn-helix domain-containing protein n=1 Tax=Paraburkholderia xenovorans TaxID=36873 RepID=UPI0002E8CE90|nr:helix-turn-helix transcriptional regulator [Paraburkholderia xenovorans]AIP30631.1 helix-turn-helix domain protein [Paraburkholderia xenovorans LB400]
MATQRGTTAPPQTGSEQTGSVAGAGNARASLGVDGAVRLATSSVTTQSYAREFARLFNVDTAHTLTTTSLKTAQLTATHMCSSVHGLGKSTPLPTEDAYILSLQLQHSGGAELWKRGRRVPTEPYAPGSIMLGHLSDEPVANLPDPFECILFHIPRPAFDELCGLSALPPVGELDDVNRTIDPVLHHLGLALVPAMADPQLAGSLFFDHVAHAMYERLATTYGRFRGTLPPRGRVLSKTQERIAKELLVADLLVEPPLSDIALACGLSVRQFVDAFRSTTGMPPFRWLRAYRIERAKELLRRTSFSLAEIGAACGFADQSHFTRTFSAATGTTPGDWRRACGA